MTPHARRVVKTIAASLFVLLLAGFTYQGVATALERRAFKYPGRLVPVGDHQLHLHCLGSGSPTVVLEAPALGFSESWAHVQLPVSKTTRVCAYDRAGLGWSEASEGAFKAQAVPEELHSLLEGAGETSPFVVVGQGLGAAYVTEFAGRFPADTAAVVLVDSPQQVGSQARTLRASPSPWLARTGILRLSQTMSRRHPDVPGPSGGAVSAFSTRPDHLRRAGQEMRQFDAVVSRANAVTLPTGPLVHRLESPAGQSPLNTPERAEPVVGVILDVVEVWRQNQQPITTNPPTTNN